eukprot:7390692-Prymnesium_polylepis.1
MCVVCVADVCVGVGRRGGRPGHVAFVAGDRLGDHHAAPAAPGRQVEQELPTGQPPAAPRTAACCASNRRPPRLEPSPAASPTVASHSIAADMPVGAASL